jgi:Fic family protein
MNLREKFRARLRDKPKALALLDELFLNPYVSVVRAERVLRVSNPTARQAVMLIQRKGMLEKITGHTWGKLYLAKPIMETIELNGKGK